MTALRRILLALVALVVVTALALAWLLLDAGGDVSGVTTAESARAQVPSAEVKSDVRDAAAKAVDRAYSFSWETIGADKADARALMTLDMQRRYDRTMAGAVTASQRDHTVVEAEVVDTALVTATQTDARVLVFVNRHTTGDDLDKPLLDLDRVLVTLVRSGGSWKVSELDSV